MDTGEKTKQKLLIVEVEIPGLDTENLDSVKAYDLEIKLGRMPQPISECVFYGP